MNKNIFISSTIYDLIDIRSELYVMLKDIGLDPIMSDIPDSNFELKPDNNSIETCLLNLEKCDHVIFILSQRYGPSLKSAGFEDYSATHLEYLHAKKAKKHIHVYVRDRLEADYAIWKKNPGKTDIKFTWVDQQNLRIFDILKAHASLAKDKPESNWYKIFKDSLELKRLVLNDFNLHAAEINIIKLLSKNEFPLLHPKLAVKITGRKMIFTVTLTNISHSPAFNLRLDWLDRDKMQIEKPFPSIDIIVPNQECPLTFLYSIGPEHNGTEKDLLLQYSHAAGYEISEIYTVRGYAITDGIISGCTLKERKFAIGKPFKIDVT